MKKLKPILTEKTTNLAKDGWYSFWVDPGLNKNQIKLLVNSAFSVNVTKVKTINYNKRRFKGYTGRTKTIQARKKAIVALKGKEKIDLFENKKKK